MTTIILIAFAFMAGYLIVRAFIGAVRQDSRRDEDPDQRP